MKSRRPFGWFSGRAACFTPAKEGEKTAFLETNELNLYVNAFIFYLEYEQSMDGCRGPVVVAASTRTAVYRYPKPCVHLRVSRESYVVYIWEQLWEFPLFERETLSESLLSDKTLKTVSIWEFVVSGVNSDVAIMEVQKMCVPP